MAQRLEFIAAVLLVTTLMAVPAAVAMEPSAKVIQAAELQRMSSIITFLRTKLASEGSYAAASPEVRLNALVESLRLFGISVPEGALLPSEGSTSELALALLDGALPTQREVLIRDVDVFLKQFPAATAVSNADAAIVVPRGRAIKRLAATSTPPSPRPIERPAAVEQFFLSPPTASTAGVASAVSATTEPSDEERRRKMAMLMERVHNRPPSPHVAVTAGSEVKEASSTRVAKVKSLLADLRAMVGEPAIDAVENPEKPIISAPLPTHDSGPSMLVGPEDAGTGRTFELPPARM